MKVYSVTYDLRVTGWNELNERLYEQSWKEPLGRFRSDFAFRGMGDASADLRTGVIRLGGGCSHLEASLLRTFRKYARRDRDTVPGDSAWNWLALAQHHGLPTRLLDWTYSPLVAMHFATEDLDQFDRDGVIWCLDTEGFANGNEGPVTDEKLNGPHDADVIWSFDMMEEAISGMDSTVAVASRSE